MMEPEGNNQVSIATLLRLAADGELSAKQEAELRAHLETNPEDNARIDFDRKLRQACSCACAPDCCAPESLRQRVLACCDQASLEHAEQTVLADNLAVRAEQTRSRSFWAGRALARFGAIAALIALIGAVAYMVGRTSPGSAPFGDTNTPTVRTAADRIASFVRKEHDRCASGLPEIGAKFDITDPAEVPAAFEAIVGKSFSLESVLDADAHGLRFLDAGLCHPPGGDALHIRFDTGEEDATPVSLWIQADDESLPIEDGVTYTKGDGCECVRFWRVDGVRYILIGSHADAGPFASLALHSPQKVKPF
ncbi:MAG: hypothetical protein Q9O74_07065 [Planctomycetota bacterium]|nr:hypothetical protein [Planctomycetota bacterium]